MANQNRKIILSDKPTRHFICRYYNNEGLIGYFILNPSVIAIESIKLANELFTIASGHLDISTINLYYQGKNEPIFFSPRIPLDYLVEGIVNFEEEVEKEYFFIEPFHPNEDLTIIPIEALHYQIQRTGVSVESFPYPNEYINGRVISMPIPFKYILA